MGDSLFAGWVADGTEVALLPPALFLLLPLAGTSAFERKKEVLNDIQWDTSNTV